MNIKSKTKSKQSRVLYLQQKILIIYLKIYYKYKQIVEYKTLTTFLITNNSKYCEYVSKICNYQHYNNIVNFLIFNNIKLI